MDLKRLTWMVKFRKLFGALTEPERPGAVYLASALAGHTQKGLPAFGIYGRDVQEISNTEIPEDVQEKLLLLCPCRFGGCNNER